MLDDRVINDFAQRLVPEAFTRRHSAHHVEIVDVRPSGAAAFDHWGRAAAPGGADRAVRMGRSSCPLRHRRSCRRHTLEVGRRPVL